MDSTQRLIKSIRSGLLAQWLALACIAMSVQSAWGLDDSKLDPALRDIKGTGVVKVGYLSDNSPFAFPASDGSLSGFSIDICTRIAEQVGKALQLKQVRQRHIEVQPDERILKLKSRDIHMECGASTNTIARQHDVAFSYTIFVSSVRMMARKGDSILDYRELAGKRVAVLKGSTAQQASQLRLRNLGVTATFIEVASDSEAVKLLEARKADVYVNDEVFLFSLVAGMTRPDDWQVVGKALTVEPYGIMLPRDAPGLVEIVDATLVAMFRSGEFTSLYDRWFVHSKMKMPISQMLKESIRYPDKTGMPETW